MEDSSNNTNRNIVIVVVVLAIVAICCLALVVGAFVMGRVAETVGQDLGEFGRVSQQMTYSETFVVGDAAKLDARVQVGSIDVMMGDGNTVEIVAEITAYGPTEARGAEVLDRMRVEASQSGDEVRFNATWPDVPSLGRTPQVDVKITVPRRTALTLDMNVGDVTVVGTEGDLDITADVGTVIVRDVLVDGNLDIETNVAEIKFEGALTEGATYEFKSDVGAIRLLLPAGSRFQIDANSDVGNVEVDFDVVGETDRDFVGKRVRGVVGGDSSTTLSLDSDVGGISVQQR